MKITMVEDNRCNMPKLKALLPGTMVEYQRHVYIKTDKSKMGKGITMDWPKGESVLFNPKYGSHRAVNADCRVQVLEQCGELEVCKVTDRRDIERYIRDNFKCGQW